ncbi:hypothetical protein [Streptomyces alkaliterrae]|uniref:ATP synthase protein I n=1 Tax=Streptomyces alkaliterrae TaxID=2213162 RepID=A0A5P0YNQ4_9ACTN|nr:hypothetical protein [Streptomyces alkaliterrae]MBB1254946.1 hypothetical protein [Streptomyces alkaliterrae]MBB1261266.1 hypothetical protein [Streptomyces alkaliterrae]MQS01530.1 hypothetical protein [Streptomyces alkaliterrae]
MQSNDARILRGAAIPTALAGLIGVGVSGAVAGGQGALGAVVGTVLVLLFFTAGLHGLGIVGRKWPELLMGAGLLVYTTQIFALLIALFIFRDADYLNGRALGFTALVCALVWPAAQAWMQTRVKTLYVDTDGPSADGGKGSDA